MASRRPDPPAEEMGNAGGVKPKTEEKGSVAAPIAGVKREAEKNEEKEFVAAPTAGVKREPKMEQKEEESVAAPTAGVKREAAADEEHGAPMASRRRVDPDLTPTTPPSIESMLRKSGQLVDAVKREFADKPDRLEEFYSMLSDYSDGSIDKYVAFDRMQDVFDGHPNLMDRFNEIIAMGCEIAVQLGHWS